MPFRDELIELLCKAENIGITLDIEECISEVRPRLLRRFWEAVHDRLQQRLRNQGLHGQWSVGVVPGRDPIAAPTDKYGGFRFTIRNPQGKSAQLYVVLQLDEWDLYTGVNFARTRPEVATDSIEALTRILQEEQFHIAIGEDARTWIGWKTHRVKVRDDRSFLIDCASDPTLVADKAIEPVIELLKNHGQEIAAVEAELAAR